MKRVERFIATPSQKRNEFEMLLTPNHEFLDVQLKNMDICLWVITTIEDPHVEPEKVRFCVLKNGEPFPPSIEAPASRKYIGTVQIDSHTDVHVFKML